MNATFHLKAASFQSEQSQKKGKSHMPDVKAVLYIHSLQFLQIESIYYRSIKRKDHHSSPISDASCSTGRHTSFKKV